MQDGLLTSPNILPVNVAAKSKFGQPTPADMAMERFPILKGHVNWHPDTLYAYKRKIRSLLLELLTTRERRYRHDNGTTKITERFNSPAT